MQMWTGKIPYHYLRSDYQVLYQLVQHKLPRREVTDRRWQLMERCWAPSPGARPTMQTVLNHLRQLKAEYPLSWRDQNLSLSLSPVKPSIKRSSTKPTRPFGLDIPYRPYSMSEYFPSPNRGNRTLNMPDGFFDFGLPSPNAVSAPKDFFPSSPLPGPRSSSGSHSEHSHQTARSFVVLDST